MDQEKKWHKILEIIKNQISSANFRTWFSQADLGEISNEKLKIYIPSAFIREQLALRYETFIKKACQEVLGKDPQIEYLVDAQRSSRGQSKEEDIFQLPTSTFTPTSNLNPKYNLANFVVGLTNNLAYAAAQAIVVNPGTSYNPLFIYGPSGVGKTHLMQAIGNDLIFKNPHLKIIYAPSEKFMNDFVESIQNKKMGDFRSRYRNCDLFLIDDIQFISGKDSMQEEFFHAFNELHTKNSQIVLTSDKPPNEISRLEPRLQSRFQGGLMVDIQLPDFDTRVAILKAKLQEKAENLPEEVLTLIAEYTPSNTRELEGKLIQILQMMKLNNKQPDLDLVKKFLGQPQISHNILDHKRVLARVNEYFNIRMSDITGPRRQKGLVLPRQIAMFILYEDCKLPMERIGQILGGRDHTTVLYGIEKIRQAVVRDREVQRLVIEIKQVLQS